MHISALLLLVGDLVVATSGAEVKTFLVFLCYRESRHGARFFFFTVFLLQHEKIRAKTYVRAKIIITKTCAFKVHIKNKSFS